MQKSDSSDVLFALLSTKFDEYDGIELNDPSKVPVPRYAMQKNPATYPKERPMSPRDRSLGSAVAWRSHEETELAPSGRAEATLTRMGAGESAVLVLFGGVDASGLVPPAVHLFDPLESRWCSPESRGISLLGRPPSARAGHSATRLGRHLVIYYGGRTDDVGAPPSPSQTFISQGSDGADHDGGSPSGARSPGGGGGRRSGGSLSAETIALAQHRSGGTRVGLTWTPVQLASGEVSSSHQLLGVR